MTRLVVVADDLTGANATGALLAAQGLRTATLIPERAEALSPTLTQDVVIMSTNSRALPADEAYLRVRACLSRFKGRGASRFSKRIDTTLRGNVSSEIDAALDELGHLEMAVVVPAYPLSGRITVGGYQIVNGIPLERTPVAKDPRTPVSRSHVPSLIQDGTHRTVGHVRLEDVLQGWETISRRLVEARDCGAEMVVVDAVTNDDVQAIAQATTHLPFQVLAVDPGPFTAFVAAASGISPTNDVQQGIRGRVVLALVGSVTPLTHTQIRWLKDALPNVAISIDARALAAGGSAHTEAVTADAVARILDAISVRSSKDTVVIVESWSATEGVVDLAGLDRQMDRAPGASATNICRGLGRITRAVLDAARREVAGLYVTGGDVTFAVLEEMDCAGIEVKTEVLPLAAFGTAIGGPHDGLMIVTKGGLVGQEDAAVQCVRYLLQRGAG